ncbi:hypothetical protein MMC10_004102 [Thelotrema lepadinum]|nr:hypothetical protein [Thelotrema lepadinum]
MAPVTSYLAALASLLTTALAAPTPSSISLEPRNTQNFTIYASSSDAAVNNLVFALYPFPNGTYTGYLYDHKSIPISIANDYNLQFNADSANLVTSLNDSLQVILDADGTVSGGPEGTSGFWIEPDTDDLAFAFGSGETQDTFNACPYSGEETQILYTVGWQFEGSPSTGCGQMKLHTTF